MDCLGSAAPQAVQTSGHVAFHRGYQGVLRGSSGSPGEELLLDAHSVLLLCDPVNCGWSLMLWSSTHLYQGAESLDMRC